MQLLHKTALRPLRGRRQIRVPERFPNRSRPHEKSYPHRVGRGPRARRLGWLSPPRATRSRSPVPRPCCPTPRSSPRRSARPSPTSRPRSSSPAASGAGIKEFCKGVGEDTIDIANSSRKIKDDELKSCVDAGVKEVQEVKIGYDGIVFATDIAGPDWALTPDDVYKALAAKIVVDGKLVDNPNTKWNQVNPALPDWDIAAYIPGEKHGTREVFEEKLLDAGCDKAAWTPPRLSAWTTRQLAKTCIAVRKDGKAVDIDGDYTETLARIDSQQDRRRRVRPRPSTKTTPTS